MNRKWETTGSIEIGNSVVVSDPCYPPGTWCMATFGSMLPGRYLCKTQVSDEKEWGMRVSAIMLVHEGFSKKSPSKVELLRNIGVDSGQRGFYDEKYFTEKSDRKSGTWDRWYKKVSDMTLRERSGIIDFIGDACS